MKNRDSKGFTLIELLIVVAIIGIIAAIAIPNLLNAIQRGKQKRTMGDMRTAATACETYSIDNNAYYKSAAANLSTLAAAMEPTYVKKLPSKDGWVTDMRYISAAPTAGTAYTITSYGKDKGINGGGTVAANGGTTDFRNDIIFSTGSFIQFPDGTQT